jgi:protein-S-isoprenylcysteine O-methyltransferase Ste14
MESFLNVKKLCQPAQAVVVLTVLSLIMEILQTKGLLNIHNLFVLTSLVICHLTIAVLLDVFCQAGHKNFSWVLIVMAGLVFVRADMYLQKGVDHLTGNKQIKTHNYGVKPSNS